MQAIHGFNFEYKALEGTATTFWGFNFMRHKGKIIPTGSRKLEVVYLNEVKPKTTGVYLLWFGERFYIGMSKDIRRRISDHMSTLNSVLGATLYGRKHKYHYGSYEIIVSHLIDNPEIKTIEVDILDICETEKDALQEEWLWFTVLISHPLNHFCLNKLGYVPDMLFFIDD